VLASGVDDVAGLEGASGLPVRGAAGAPSAPLGLLACAVVAALLWLAAPAGAHAVLLDTEPGDGTVVKGAPEEVVLVFSEPMQQPATVVVTGPEGLTVADGTAEVDGERVVMPLEAVTADGVHTVVWRAVSADDHPIDGQFTFEVIDAEVDSSIEEPEATPTPDPTPEGAPTPFPQPDDAVEGAVGAADDAEGDGVLGWLLAGAAALAVLGAAGAALANRRQQPDRS
jgi:copper resistance protein C